MGILVRYDAYVVVGYGPKAIAMNDRTRTPFKGLEDDNCNEESSNSGEVQKPLKPQAKESKSDSAKANKYQIAARWTIESKYLKVSDFLTKQETLGAKLVYETEDSTDIVQKTVTMVE